MIRRTYTCITIGAGILLIIAGALKVPGGILAGVALAVLGLCLFGMSFIPVGAPGDDAPPQMSFLQQLAGIFFEPSRVFRTLRSYPTWFLALVLICIFNFAYSVAFTFRLTPERIVSYAIDKTAESGWIPAEMVEQTKQQQIEETKNPVRLGLGFIPQFLAALIVTAIAAGIILLGVMVLGGKIGFWQAFAVSVWTDLPVTIISRVLSLVLLYVKDPDDIHPMLGQNGLLTDNLGVLFKPAEHPVLFAAATSFGILAFYRVWLMATGIKNGGERVTAGTAWSISIAFWVIKLLLGAASGAIFGNFLS